MPSVNEKREPPTPPPVFSKQATCVIIMRMKKTKQAEKASKPGKFIRVVHDCDCPKCGFPEISREINLETGEQRNWQCSSSTCAWKAKDYNHPKKQLAGMVF